jgi:hypothetical protein
MIDLCRAFRSFKQRRNTMRPLKTLTLTLLLMSALPMFGAAYIKFDGVDGESKAAGHEKWIELNSLQNDDGTPVAGTLSQGRVRLTTSFGILVKLDHLCQSKRPLGEVLIDVDGKRHTLRNARFAECPTRRGDLATAVLEVSTVSTDAWPQKVEIGALKAGVQSTAAVQGNATITRLGRTPLSMNIRRATLDGKVATIYLKAGTVSDALGKAVFEATAKGTYFPVIGIESAGQQWSFTKVLFTNVSLQPAQDATVSFQFETMNGSAAAFQALGN